MARQFVYFMQGLTKSYPTRKVLDNVHLSFYPDAKIGVLGVNGSGKSTLLKIMAGIDKEYNGEAWVAEGARVGYLEQEPQLDPGKTVRENVMLGVAKQKAILDRYNELAMNYSWTIRSAATSIAPWIRYGRNSQLTWPVFTYLVDELRHAFVFEQLAVRAGERADLYQLHLGVRIFHRVHPSDVSLTTSLQFSAPAAGWLG